MKTALIRLDAAAGAGYPLRLFVDDGEDDWLERPQAETTIPSPLPPPAADDLPTAAAIRELVLSEGASSDAFERAGAYLHDLLAAGEVGRRWKELREAGDGVRMLLDVRAEDLRSLPWELMRRESPLPLFADETNPCARVHRLGEVQLTADCTPLLRVLVVLGVAPDDLEIGAGRELEQLREAFRRLWGLVDLEVLDRPTQAELERRYTELQPHVLHFIGHGAATDAGGELQFEGRDGEDGWTWSATAIAALLAAWRPRLAFMNACRSGDESSIRGAWQIADALLDAQVPAVVAMQGDIRGDAAAAFTGAVYAALADDRPLDVAVVAGRRAISYDADWRRRDPWLPCLWLSVPPERVLPQRYGVTPQQRILLERQPTFGALKRLVDRTTERRRLWRQLNGDGAQEIGAAVAVVGPAEVGKSGLVQWAIGSSALRGANVAYVDFNQKEKLDFVEALTEIERELCASPVHGEANRGAFAGFGAATSPFRAGGENVAEDAVDTVFDAFSASLRGAAAERQLVLALDHLHGIAPGHWRFLLEKLIEPVAVGALPVFLIVVHRPDDQNTAATQRASIERIEVGRLPPEQYRELVSLYLRAQGYAPRDFKALVDGVAATMRRSWAGEVFAWLDQTASVLEWQREDG